MNINVNAKIEHFVEKYGQQFGVKAEDFETPPVTEQQRMSDLEDCILELAEIIGGEG